MATDHTYVNTKICTEVKITGLKKQVKALKQNKPETETFKAVEQFKFLTHNFEGVGKHLFY